MAMIKTAAEWQSCTNSGRMLETLTPNRSPSRRRGILMRKGPLTPARQQRLLAAACCRQVWDDVADEGVRYAIEACERFVDHFLTARDLEKAKEVAHERWLYWRDKDYHAGQLAYAAFCASSTTGMDNVCSILENLHSHDEPRRERIRRGHCDLIRDIFGNPFVPVSFDPAWGNTAARSLAAAMYEARRFDEMPILGDAIEEAGCTDNEVLRHCRTAPIHARGCWVIEHVLGRGTPRHGVET